MENLRPYLTEKANSIVKAHLNGQGSLTDLTVKTAKAEGLNDIATRTLTGITNQQYIEITKQHEFEPSNPEMVFQGLYGEQPTIQKVAYEYPEYYPSVNKPTEKTASIEEPVYQGSKTPLDISKPIKALFTNDVYSLKVKRAHLHGDCEELFSKSASLLDTLKLHGFTTKTVRDSLFNLGFKSASVLDLAERLLAKSNQLPAGNNIKSAFYDTETLVQELGSNLQEFLSKYASYSEVENEFKTRMQWRDKIYSMGSTYV